MNYESPNQTIITDKKDDDPLLGMANPNEFYDGKILPPLFKLERSDYIGKNSSIEERWGLNKKHLTKKQKDRLNNFNIHPKTVSEMDSE
jgi:hypothetical protein